MDGGVRSRGGKRGLWGVLRKLCGSCQGPGVEDGASDSWSAGSVPRKGPPIERNLLCNLEDLYRGTTKKMKITRDVLSPNGKVRTVEEILTLNIKPGWKKGTRVTFTEKGNERRNMIPSDVVFIIDERPHGVYRREGDDLVVEQQISLLEALTGYTTKLTTLDGRNLVVSIANIIHPGYEEVVEGEGMPTAKESHKKGNLRLRFKIKFPNKLSDEQKTAIREVTTPFLTN